MLPCASQPTSVGRLKLSPATPAPTTGGWLEVADVDRLRLAADRHQDAAVLVELHDQVGGLVNHPDVVLRVDTDDVREHEAVDADPDLADEGALVVELEQARAAVREDARPAERGGRRPRARVDEDVALRVGGDARHFTEIQLVGQLQEVRHRVERNLGNRQLRAAELLLRGKHVARGDEGERDDRERE